MPATVAYPLAPISGNDMKLRHSLPVLVLALVPLAAQTAVQAAAPHVLVEAVGPDGWRTRFAPTNVGSLLDSQAGRALWEPNVMPWFGMWQHLVGDEAAFAPVRGRMLGYGGRVRLAIWLGEGDLSHQGPFSVALVLDGDGHTDLSALAADVQQLQSGIEGQWDEQDLGGSKVRVLTNGGDAMTGPVVGEHAVVWAMASKEKLAASLAAARALAADADGKPPAPATPALRVVVDMPALVGLARAHHAQEGGGGDEWPTAQALGVECLGPTTLTLTTAGPQVEFELAQAFAGAPSGVFAALFPPTGTLPALQHLLPKDGSWKIGRFDLLALYDAIEKAAAVNDVDLDDARKEMRDDMGCDLRDDLLAHMTDELLFLGSPVRDSERLAETGWALAWRLRDRAAFEKSLDIALAHAKPALSREATIEDGDAKLHRYGNMFGYDLWFAVGSDLFVIAGGADTEARLESLLHTENGVAPATATGEPTLPKGLASLRRHLPPGLNGLASGDLDSLTAIPAVWWLGMLREIVPFVNVGRDEEPDDDAAEQLRDLLRQHQLDTLRSATGHAERTWRWRLFW